MKKRTKQKGQKKDSNNKKLFITVKKNGEDIALPRTQRRNSISSTYHVQQTRSVDTKRRQSMEMNSALIGAIL